MVLRRVGFAELAARGSVYPREWINFDAIIVCVCQGIASFLFIFPCFWLIETGSGIGQARLGFFILLRLVLSS